jgi:hypothetical protein
MNITELSPQQLRKAAQIKEKIASLQNELNRLLGGAPEQAAPKKKRKMSAEGRAKISAAAKKRWAEVKAAKKK